MKRVKCSGHRIAHIAPAGPTGILNPHGHSYTAHGRTRHTLTENTLSPSGVSTAGRGRLRALPSTPSPPCFRSHIAPRPLRYPKPAPSYMHLWNSNWYEGGKTRIWGGSLPGVEVPFCLESRLGDSRRVSPRDPRKPPLANNGRKMPPSNRVC